MTGLFAGASAAEEVLKRETGKLTVLVVWEPILPSDWSRPTRPVMARIPDSRVIQFWDKDHLIAEQLSRQLRTKQPTCCRRHRCARKKARWSLAIGQFSINKVAIVEVANGVSRSSVSQSNMVAVNSTLVRALIACLPRQQ
jgi:hypothetical protein